MFKKNIKLIVWCLIFWGLPNFVLAYPDGQLLQKNNLIYEGAFRVPQGRTFLGTTTAYGLEGGGSALGFNPIRGTLIMIGHLYERFIYEVSIPELLKTNDFRNLNTANVVQAPLDITDNHWTYLGSNGESIDTSGARPGGLMVFNGRLIGTSWGFYDAATKAARSHYTASLDWATTGTQYQGMYQVGLPVYGASNGGYVGGYLATVPVEWQPYLGGPALTGLGGVAIVTRSSYGPSAWVFNPDDLGVTDPVDATMLVGYPAPIEHMTLSQPGVENIYFNSASEVRGLVFPERTRSVLFFGRHGAGTSKDADGNLITNEGLMCYGDGTSVAEDVASNSEIADWINANGGAQYLCGTNLMTADGGNSCCYDPSDSSKGVHAYPYSYRVWAYDANELVAVKNGIKNPWDVQPYAIWDLDLPYSTADPNILYSNSVEGHRILGVAYNPEGNRIYIAQDVADRPISGGTSRPIVHVFSVNIDSETILPSSPQGLSVW